MPSTAAVTERDVEGTVCMLMGRCPRIRAGYDAAVQSVEGRLEWCRTECEVATQHWNIPDRRPHPRTP